MLDAHLGNGTGRRTVRIAVPLLVTSGPVTYEVVLHSWATSPMRGRSGFEPARFRFPDFLELEAGAR